MRKITREAAKMFFDFTIVKELPLLKVGHFGRNTTVIACKRDDTTGGVSLYLHGNIIAKYKTKTGVLEISLRGWPTPTTKERLNGLFDIMNMPFKFHTKNFVTYLSGKYVDNTITNLEIGAYDTLQFTFTEVDGVRVGSFVAKFEKKEGTC